MRHTSVIQQVKQQWGLQHIQSGGNVLPEEIKRFECENKVILPMDFCEYLTTLNGMADGETDKDLMRFWTLEEIKICICGNEPEYQVVSENFYIFADYSIGVFYYAIELFLFSSPSNRICVIGGPSPIFIAQSFTEFLAVYVAGEAFRY